MASCEQPGEMKAQECACISAKVAGDLRAILEESWEWKSMVGVEEETRCEKTEAGDIEDVLLSLAVKSQTNIERLQEGSVELRCFGSFLIGKIRAYLNADGMGQN